jgi:hypothetical protein
MRCLPQWSSKSILVNLDDHTLSSHTAGRYVNRTTAFREGLAFFTTDQIPGIQVSFGSSRRSQRNITLTERESGYDNAPKIQVDNWTPLPVGTPRHSVRLHSVDVFNKGLFVIDVKLMPWG